MKKAETVELENKPDGTDRGDGRVESVDERWRTMENDGDGERNSGVVGDDVRSGRSRRCRTGKDRRGQRTVEADGRSNSRRTQSRNDKTLYLQQHTTQINNLTQQQSTKLRKLS